MGCCSGSSFNGFENKQALFFFFSHQKKQNCIEEEALAACKSDHNGANACECLPTHQSRCLPAPPHHYPTFHALPDRHPSTRHSNPRSPSFWKIDLALIFVTDGVDSLRMKKSASFDRQQIPMPLVVGADVALELR